MITSVFMNNRTQAVRLPSIYRFSETTLRVMTYKLNLALLFFNLGLIYNRLNLC